MGPQSERLAGEEVSLGKWKSEAALVSVLRILYIISDMLLGALHCMELHSVVLSPVRCPPTC